MAKKKTHEEFAAELSQINPNVILLGRYTRSKDPIECRCKTCGHEWPGLPYNLLNYHGCYPCSREVSAEKRHKTAVQKGSLAQKFPHLADEWDYERNVGKTPSDVSYGCDYEAHWICPLGHRYTVKVCERTKKKSRGCNVCNARNSTSFPEQAIYFYIKKQFPSAINRYKEGFGRQELDIYIPNLNVGIEYDGRAWHKEIDESEIKKYAKCREMGISLIRIREDSSIKSAIPTYDTLLPSGYAVERYEGLDKTIRSLFQILHLTMDVDTRRDSMSIREQYYTALKEGSLAHLYPELAKEWDYERNGDLRPEMFLPGCQEKVFWICPKGHSYPAWISDRVHGVGCSKCVGLKKKTTEEFKLEMAEKDPNIIVLGEYINSKTGIHCQCAICGCEWDPTPNVLLDGHGCRDCANRQRSIYKKEYHAKKKNREL